jgi:8-oxo-dGTP diphosphatase
MKLILINTLLLVIAIFLLKYLWLISLCITIITGLTMYKEKKVLSFFSTYIKSLAYSLDQFGNVLCKDLFDFLFLKTYSCHYFGNPDETISSVLGKNEREETLTNVGKVITWILNKIDYNHTKDAIEEDEIIDS